MFNQHLLLKQSPKLPFPPTTREKSLLTFLNFVDHDWTIPARFIMDGTQSPIMANIYHGRVIYNLQCYKKVSLSMLSHNNNFGCKCLLTQLKNQFYTGIRWLNRLFAFSIKLIPIFVCLVHIYNN